MVMMSCGVVNIAHAAYVDYSLEGKFDYIDPSYVGVLTTDSIISGTVHFDNSSITGVGTETVSISDDVNATLSLNVGGVLLDKTDDYGYQMLGHSPYANYSDGIFTGISFYYYSIGTSTSQATYVSFRIDNGNLDLLGNGFLDYGHGSVSYSNVSPVPIPSAFWLFSSSVFCLFGIKRKRRCWGNPWDQVIKGG